MFSKTGLTSDANETEVIPKCIKKTTAVGKEESTGSSSEGSKRTN